MTLTIDLPPDLEQRLNSAAKQRGLTPEEFVLVILEEHLKQLAEPQWHEEVVGDWSQFTELLDKIVTPLPDQRHHFFYRGQVCKDWRLESSIFRQLKNKKNDLPRCFEIEQDSKKEFESQLHLHMDPAGLPKTNDWLEWWALMQHYDAPTRLLDWTTSPYVAAYFAVESNDQSDGLIWVLNDWALGDRMSEIDQYSNDWSGWDESITRPTNNWAKVASRFNCNWKRFFNKEEAPQIFFFQPARKSPRVVAQQGWLSTPLNLFADYETIIGASYKKHREDPNHHKKYDAETREYWKYWNSRIVIPKERKPEFLRRLQTMNITANALFPGVGGLGRSIKEFVQTEVLHNHPGSSHPF